FSSRRRHTRSKRDWSSDVCSSDLTILADLKNREFELQHAVSDEEAAEVVRRGIKRRREAAEQYTAAGRADRAEAELAEGKALEEIGRASCRERGGGWGVGGGAEDR